MQVGTASRVVAVGSRDQDRATALAARYGVDHAHGSYQRLLEDPQVDAIYIASPASEHRKHALHSLSAGKPVLVEKADRASVTRRVGAVLAEQHDEWAEARRYLGLDVLAKSRTANTEEVNTEPILQALTA